VARFIGSIAHILKVDDWAANDFAWDEEGYLSGPKTAMVDSHDKGEMVDKLLRINGFQASKIWTVGDSGTDLSMQIPDSNFIGFNPARERSMNEFTKANVPVIIEKDLTKIWNIIFSEDFPKDD